MAKKNISVSFRNATINLENMVLDEFDSKNESFESYSIYNILREWDQVDGVSITIKKDITLELQESEEQDGEPN